MCLAGSSATTVQGEREEATSPTGQQMVEGRVSFESHGRALPVMTIDGGGCSEENQSSNFDGVIGNE